MLGLQAEAGRAVCGRSSRHRDFLATPPHPPLPTGLWRREGLRCDRGRDRLTDADAHGVALCREDGLCWPGEGGWMGGRGARIGAGIVRAFGEGGGSPGEERPGGKEESHLQS